MQHEIRSLTGLRGVAALYVVNHHIYMSLNNENTATFLRNGYLAVDLFFVLSGFVMAATYAEMFREGFSGEAYRAFLVKRVARLYPLYLVLTLGNAALILPKGVTDFYGSNFPLTLFANLFMLQAWGLAIPIVEPSWSISTEWAAYLLFPMTVRHLLYGRRVLAMAGGIICVLALTAVSLVDLPIVQGSQTTRIGPLNLYAHDSIGPIVRCLCGFVLGVLAYRVRREEAVTRLVGSNFFVIFLSASVVGLLFVRNSDIAVVTVFPALIIGLSHERSIVAKILGSKPVWAIGVWSYSIYLIHLPFVVFRHVLAVLFAAFSIPGAAAISTITTLIAVVTLSYYSYNGIEKTGREFVQKLLQRSASKKTARNEY